MCLQYLYVTCVTSVHCVCNIYTYPYAVAVCTCVHMYMSVYSVCAHVCASVCMCIHEHMYNMGVYMNAYMCVCVHVWFTRVCTLHLCMYVRFTFNHHLVFREARWQPLPLLLEGGRYLGYGDHMLGSIEVLSIVPTANHCQYRTSTEYIHTTSRL